MGSPASAAIPRSITIEGPESRVNAIETAMTDPVDATGVVGTGDIHHPCLRSRSPGASAKAGPIHVTVTTEQTTAGKPGQP